MNNNEIPEKIKPYILDYTQDYQARRIAEGTLAIHPSTDYIREYTDRIKKGWLNVPKGYKHVNADWLLTESGDMWHVTDYFIEHERLDEDDWFIHLMGKTWFDANTFMPAYIEACRRNNIKEITFRMRY